MRSCGSNFSLVGIIFIERGVGWEVNLNSFLTAVARLCLNKQALQLTLKLIKPVGLIVILHSQHNGVQEHANQYGPIKCLRLDHATHFYGKSIIPLYKPLEPADTEMKTGTYNIV